MKKITQSIFLLICSIGFSQNAPIDFETGGHGATWGFTMFENASNPALEIVNNPFATGGNTSSKVAKFTALQAGMPWAGCETLHGAGIGTFNLTSANCVVKMWVYKTVISDVGIKFATASGDSSGEIKVANTLVNQWEQLTFNFAGKIGEPTSTGIDQIIFFPDFTTRTGDNVVYFDNITFSAGTVSDADPVVGAPNPTIPPADVMSMFSNVYTDIPMATWKTDWSMATMEEVQVSGNDTKKYTGLLFAGIEPVTPMNVTGMTHFNITVWSPSFTTFGVKLVDYGANGVHGGDDDTEHEIVYNSPAQNQWVTYHIPLSSFTGLAARDHVAQIIISSSNAKVYVDNVFFNTETVITPVTDPTVAAPDPTLPADKVMSMFSNVYTNVAVDTWRTDWSAANLEEVQIAGNDTKKYTALNFVGIETVASPLNITGMTHFNVNVWSPDFTVFKVKLVDFGANGVHGGGDDSEHEITYNSPAQSQWITYRIPLSDFSILLSQEHIGQLIFASSGAKVYIDNVYFSNEVVAPTDPVVAAPNPTLPANQVISMFSNTYTNVPVDTWRTPWSDAAMTETQIAGNDVKKYTALNFVGIEAIASQLDITNMTHFNVDVWSSNFNQFRVKLVDFGANAVHGGGDDVEHEITFNSPAQGQWITYHIPISDFINLITKQNIAQLIFAAGGANVYVDNVYFSRDTPLAVSENVISKVKMYPNPASSMLNIVAPENIQEVTILNTIGQQVRRIQPGSREVNLNVDSLSKGIYIVNTTINGKTRTEKLVIQ